MRSAVVVFRPAIKKAVEGMRKGVLFMTVLRAESGYSREDTMALTEAYTKVLMPDFKFTSGSENQRALAAIEAQKIKNTEYANNPFVSPVRLATFEPAAYAAFEGSYVRGKNLWTFKRNGDAFVWPYNEKESSPRRFYPAGERLLVSADGKMTIEFEINEQGAVTGVEERQHRYFRTIPRKVEPAKNSNKSKIAHTAR